MPMPVYAFYAAQADRPPSSGKAGVPICAPQLVPSVRFEVFILIPRPSSIRISLMTFQPFPYSSPHGFGIR